jgi:rhodanese-related sulfurtransferase
VKPSQINAWDIPEITVGDLDRLLKNLAGDEQADQPLLLDVREPAEWQICRLPGAVLAPLSELARQGLAVLPAGLTPEAPIVIYCHHGVRSAQVTAWLLKQGFHNVVSLAGGIDAWSVQIDPSIPRYF